MGARRLSWLCTRARGSCCLPSPACGAAVGSVGWLSRVGPARLLSLILRGWCPGRRLLASPEPCPSFEAVAARPCPSGPFFLPALCSPITACVPVPSFTGEVGSAPASLPACLGRVPGLGQRSGCGFSGLVALEKAPSSPEPWQHLSLWLDEDQTPLVLSLPTGAYVKP